MNMGLLKQLFFLVELTVSKIKKWFRRNNFTIFVVILLIAMFVLSRFV